MKIGKKGWIIFTIFVGVLFFGGAQSAQAAYVPINQFDGVTLVDNSGQAISGPKIDNHNLISLSYFGTALTKDITYQPANSSSIYSYTNESIIIGQGSVIRVTNVGFYNGNPIKVAFKVDRDVKLTNLNTEMRITPTSKDGHINVEFWIENLNNQRIVDENSAVMLPMQMVYARTSSDRYQITSFSSDSQFKNFVVSNQSTVGTSLIDNDTNNGTSFNFRFSNTSTSNVSTSIGYPLTDNNLKIQSDTYSGQYPSANPFPIVNDGISLFNKSVTILFPLAAQLPAIIDTENDDSFQVKTDVRQALQIQGEDSLYSKQLTLDINYPNFVNTTDNINNLKVFDNANNDITSKLEISSKISGEISIVIPQAMLKQLQNNNLTVTGTFDIDPSSEELLTYFNKDTGYFNIPVTATNNENDSSVSGTNEVKMPLPTGNPIEQTVEIGKTTDDLTADDLVKDLKSTLTNDTVVVEGFKTYKEFSQLGSDSVIVKIKSMLTGVESEITIPVNVVPSTVKMTMKQVYTGTDTPIYSNLETKLPVDNTVSSEEMIGDTITTVMNNQISAGAFTLNYEGYDDVTVSDYKIYQNGVEVTPKPTTVPNEDFTIVYEYNGQLKFKDVAKKLDFGSITISEDSTKTPLSNSSDETISIINTVQNSSWKLKASMPTGINQTDGKKQAFLGSVIYKNATGTYQTIGQSATIIETQKDNSLYSQLGLKNDSTEMLLQQDAGNLKGSYTGSLVWTLEDTP